MSVYNAAFYSSFWFKFTLIATAFISMKCSTLIATGYVKNSFQVLYIDLFHEIKIYIE